MKAKIQAKPQKIANSKSGPLKKPVIKSLNPVKPVNNFLMPPDAKQINIIKVAVESKETISRNSGGFNNLQKSRGINRTYKKEQSPHITPNLAIKPKEQKTASLKTRCTSNPSSAQEPSNEPTNVQRSNLLYRAAALGMHKKHRAFFETLNGSTKDCYLCARKKRFKDVIRNNLNSKYLTSRTVYDAKIINDIVFNENTHIVAKFKDYLIYDDINENLKRYYTIQESKRKLVKTLAFYNKYYKIAPNYSVMNYKNYMLLNIAEKQKLINERQEYEIYHKNHMSKNILEIDQSTIKNKVFTTRFIQDLNKESKDSLGKILEDFIVKDSLSLIKPCKINTLNNNHHQIIQKKHFNLSQIEITQNLLSEVKKELEKYAKTHRAKSQGRTQALGVGKKRKSLPCKDEIIQSRNSGGIKIKNLLTTPKNIAFETIKEFVKPLGKSLLKQASQELRKKFQQKTMNRNSNQNLYPQKYHTEKSGQNIKRKNRNKSQEEIFNDPFKTPIKQKKRSASVMCDAQKSKIKNVKVIDLAVLKENLRKQKVKIENSDMYKTPIKHKKNNYLNVIGQLIKKEPVKKKVIKLKYSKNIENTPKNNNNQNFRKLNIAPKALKMEFNYNRPQIIL